MIRILIYVILFLPFTTGNMAACLFFKHLAQQSIQGKWIDKNSILNGKSLSLAERIGLMFCGSFVFSLTVFIDFMIIGLLMGK